MTNLLFTSWYVGLGGGETDLISLAQHLDTDRYTPHLLLPHDGQLAEHWRAAGWPVHIVPFRGATTWFVPSIWARFPVVKTLRTLIAQHDIRAVHSDYHSLPFALPAARAAGIPLLWTCWGWWFRPKPWQKNFYRSIDAIFARSVAIRDGFLGDPPFMAPEALPIVYSGVDTERFHPGIDGDSVRADAGVAADAPVVVLIARFQSVKGHHIFQAMARQVAQQMPEARFIVAGEDVHGVAADADYKAQILRTQQADPLLRERLHYIGFRDDVERVIAAADVVVCSSEFESYGRSIVEAMACQTPVVSTRRGGPSETVVDGETGYLVDPSDEAGLARQVLALLRDPDLRRRMGVAGRQRVEAHFSARATAQPYTALFDQWLLP